MLSGTDRVDRHVIALADAGDPGTDRTEQALRSVIAAEPGRLFPVVRFSVPWEAIDAVRLGIPADRFIAHGSRRGQLAECGIDATGIASTIQALIEMNEPAKAVRRLSACAESPTG